MHKRNHKWMYVKLSGDISPYICCTNCGKCQTGGLEIYNKKTDNMEIKLLKPPKYCSYCGSKNTLYNGAMVYFYSKLGEYTGKHRVYPRGW